MSLAPTVADLDALRAFRRSQMTAVADALQAAHDLADVMAVEAARRPGMTTTDQFLDGAPDEQTRGYWQSLLERCVRRIPTSTNGDH